MCHDFRGMKSRESKKESICVCEESGSEKSVDKRFQELYKSAARICANLVDKREGKCLSSDVETEKTSGVLEN